MVQDIRDTSFLTRIPFLRPYVLLARWDRPIGFWLLFWPCVWGLALAPSFAAYPLHMQIYYVVLFLIGAILMRGAGCTLNDLFDRDLDAKVERTKTRPLASQIVKPWHAFAFMVIQLALGAAVLLQLSPVAIVLGFAMIPLIATYPLMKRFVWGPQIFLALNFASGSLFGWATMENNLGIVPLLLYLSGICWVTAYDTVYAHMDVADDVLAGIKSTARWWGPNSKLYIGWLWLASFALFAAALVLADSHWVSYLMLFIAVLVQFTAQTFWNPDNNAYSLRYFRLQHQIGFLLAMAALAPVVF